MDDDGSQGALRFEFDQLRKEILQNDALMVQSQAAMIVVVGATIAAAF